MQARFRRVLLAIAVLAVGSLAYAGLASGAGKIQIAVFYYNPSPYGVASYKAAQVEAAKLGVSTTVFDANNDPELQNTQMSDAITTGKYKAFWVWALDGPSIAPTIKKAEQKGIKVATADYTLGTLQQQVHLSYTPGL
ncbi:MAG TPA: substrate-binding domain-containing protein, partial [Solirubrobacteraceae bacterium]|nr:substrate-binding domain-containing protein [Solirubrobacteraceae bacterium]